MSEKDPRNKKKWHKKAPDRVADYERMEGYKSGLDYYRIGTEGPTKTKTDVDIGAYPQRQPGPEKWSVHVAYFEPANARKPKSDMEVAQTKEIGDALDKAIAWMRDNPQGAGDTGDMEQYSTNNSGNGVFGSFGDPFGIGKKDDCGCDDDREDDPFGMFM